MNKNTSRGSDSSTAKNRAVIWIAVSSERQANEEKVSLEQQEYLARQWCKENDYHVVRLLEVRGYSRRESDIVTLLEDYREQGIYAYEDLRRMWQNDEFDVLIAYAHDRLGRSTTVHSWVVENTVKSGKQIFLLADGGFIDENNFRMNIAIGGMMSAAPVDRLIRASSAAKDKLIEQGLPTGATIPLSHRLVRDSQSGKALYLELDEDKTQLFEDLATLLLEGVAYNFLGRELKQRYGHTKPNGKKLRSTMFYELLYTPTFWGHMARGYSYASKNGNQRGAWIFDETVPVPDGVKIARNVIPAVYEGELARKVKAELYRRMEIGGKRKPKYPYRFAGLFICGECGSNMNTRSKPRRGVQGLKCARVYSRTIEGQCSQRYLTTKAYLQDQIELFLERAIEGTNPDIYAEQNNPNEKITKLKKLQAERDKVQAQVFTLIDEQSKMPESTRALYRTRIENLSNQLQRLDEEALALQRVIEEASYSTAEVERTIDDLRQLTLECFWRLPDREINQWLRRLLGKNKFVIVDREIVDIREKSRKKRKSGRQSK